MITYSDYQKGDSAEDKGCVMINEFPLGQSQYIAITVATSKTFKSIKGAEKYMLSLGYVKLGVKKVGEHPSNTLANIEKRVQTSIHEQKDNRSIQNKMKL